MCVRKKLFAREGKEEKGNKEKARTDECV